MRKEEGVRGNEMETLCSTIVTKKEREKQWEKEIEIVRE